MNNLQWACYLPHCLKSDYQARIYASSGNGILPGRFAVPSPARIWLHRLISRNNASARSCCSRTNRFGNPGDYPCLCLCFGFSQIILMLPFLLITLHFSQIGFTDDLTFMENPPLLSSDSRRRDNSEKRCLFPSKYGNLTDFFAGKNRRTQKRPNYILSKIFLYCK